jgi:SNF2 family DNA or RNA helicase
MENRLLELWSLFNVVLPGALGDEKRFRRVFATPIEKRGDAGRRAELAARVRPFLLRRTKEKVASDLPSRTEVTNAVELEGAQRDLYETIRLAMHRRVAEEVRRRGFDRSRIIILDALLKLRQVCCDPRLVKLPEAGRVRASAKFEALLEMLDEMLAEGRRVLLYSQFTSMLGLIEHELGLRGVRFVKLTGATRDRATPIREFQSGKVALFLISLKAGGTGLNLTAADSVILYDPWWNPAVEDQAAGRAHRIGQDKPVFVYRLIAAGSVEERILALQERKRDLARAVLGAGDDGSAPLTADDVEALLRPLG